MGSVDAPGPLAGHLDPAVGSGADLRVHAGPSGGDPARPPRPHDHRTRHAVGQPLNVGIIGCGTIVGAYLATFPRLKAVKLVAAADIDFSRAAAVARQQVGVRAMSVADLLADAQVDVVLNLTVPAAHAEVALRA